ncbi:hypothetical protein J7384_04685 [Endozoicomonas sp. G2_1]|uniref:hypothetical protein n=1 Tax=Endozoicomonas sp. G2_1 TaxID=2821091 RepID=UPI001ADC1A3E|nr:hypothetical protein [Endozoicomonas sp. G2_1]MBO9489655.1 hypothetical protein [Endozoicomonas sp. G2_1]
MTLFKALIKWAYEAFWLIWVFLIVYLIHQLILLPCNELSLVCIPETQINKYYASTIQLLGGGIIILNIDSNLGLFKKTNIVSHSLAIIKSFPLNKKLTTVTKQHTFVLNFESNIKNRGYKGPSTIEEHIEVLQKQIDWLKDDLKNHHRELSEKINEQHSVLSEKIASTKTEVNSLETKIINSAVGSLKPQILGFVLICYGAWLNII